MNVLEPYIAYGHSCYFLYITTTTTTTTTIYFYGC